MEEPNRGDVILLLQADPLAGAGDRVSGPARPRDVLDKRDEPAGPAGRAG